MASIAEIFRGMRGNPPPVVNNSPTATSPNQPPNPQDRIPQNNPNADPTRPGSIPPSGSSNPTANPEPISPLDNFKGLWDSPTTADGKPKVDPLAQPLLNTDPAKLAQTARQMDFTQGINPELMAKALGGDQKAFADILNGATQNAFIAAATLNTNVVENATKTNNSRLDSTMEAKFKEFLVNQQRSDNPVLQHKAVAPILDLAKKQLTQQHPDKSASEIQQMAEQYVGDFAGAFTDRTTEETARKANVGPKADDFSQW